MKEPCQICGNPLPKQRAKYCCDVCAEKAKKLAGKEFYARRKIKNQNSLAEGLSKTELEKLRQKWLELKGCNDYG